jgi:hypothetical protein
MSTDLLQRFGHFAGDIDARVCEATTRRNHEPDAVRST